MEHSVPITSYHFQSPIKIKFLKYLTEWLSIWDIFQQNIITIYNIYTKKSSTKYNNLPKIKNILTLIGTFRLMYGVFKL